MISDMGSSWRLVTSGGPQRLNSGALFSLFVSDLDEGADAYSAISLVT